MFDQLPTEMVAHICRFLGFFSEEGRSFAQANRAANEIVVDSRSRFDRLRTEEKVAQGKQDEDIALYLLKNFPDALGRYDVEAVSRHHENPQCSISQSTPSPHISGQFLMDLARAHPSAKKYILEKLSEKLSEAQRNELRGDTRGFRFPR